MRIENLRIENFRGFRLLRMKGLGRINLIVGDDRSGKTTVLEAISVLSSGGDASAIWSILYRRGEIAWVASDGKTGPGSTQFEIKELFHDREICDLAFFRISADTDRGEVATTAKIERFRPAAADDPLGPGVPPGGLDGEATRPLLLKVAWSPGTGRQAIFPIDRRGGISAAMVRRTARIGEGWGFPVRYLADSSPNTEALAVLFEKIADTPEQELVTDWLKVIEPVIERVSTAGAAAAGATTHHGSRGGPVVRLRGVNDWLPIGALGVGGLRLFALAVNLVHSANGILLVDGIDIGIDHAIMEGVWKMLAFAAGRYDVQVFATTRGGDCLESLAATCRERDSDRGDVTIQRIERGREEAVAYSEGAIIAAARHDIEVR